jgi:putative tryptophan/tyrosine transport system substrate-binding protein
MKRREFIGLIGAVVFGSSRPADAQTVPNLPIVALLAYFKDDDYTRQRIAALRSGLQDFGLVEGKNYSLAVRYAEGDARRVVPQLKELGALNPRVFVTMGFGAGPNWLFPEIPLVFTGVAVDPVALGWVQSYVHPGGMITGNVMNAVGGEVTLTQKRIGFFKQLVPSLTRLGMIAPLPALQGATATLARNEREALQIVAGQLGFELVFYGLNTLDDLDDAFAAGIRDDVSGFYISGEAVLSANVSRVIPLVVASKRPSVGPYPLWGRSGLLMSYSTDPLEGFRHAGAYVARILKGDKPGDLPIEQASKFTLVINLKTAKALGIEVPASLLAIADEVIE